MYQPGTFYFADGPHGQRTEYADGGRCADYVVWAICTEHVALHTVTTCKRCSVKAAILNCVPFYRFTEVTVTSLPSELTLP